jgi:hypothetical protein
MSNTLHKRVFTPDLIVELSFQQELSSSPLAKSLTLYQTTVGLGGSGSTKKPYLKDEVLHGMQNPKMVTDQESDVIIISHLIILIGDIGSSAA